jgi:hypothetical protein
MGSHLPRQQNVGPPKHLALEGSPVTPDAAEGQRLPDTDPGRNPIPPRAIVFRERGARKPTSWCLLAQVATHSQVLLPNPRLRHYSMTSIDLCKRQLEEVAEFTQTDFAAEVRKRLDLVDPGHHPELAKWAAAELKQLESSPGQSRVVVTEDLKTVSRRMAMFQTVLEALSPDQVARRT